MFPYLRNIYLNRAVLASCVVTFVLRLVLNDLHPVPERLW